MQRNGHNKNERVMSESVTPCHPKEAEEQARNMVVFDARSNDVQNGKKKRQSQNRWGRNEGGKRKSSESMIYYGSIWHTVDDSGHNCHVEHQRKLQGVCRKAEEEKHQTVSCCINGYIIIFTVENRNVSVACVRA